MTAAYRLKRLILFAILIILFPVICLCFINEDSDARKLFKKCFSFYYGVVCVGLLHALRRYDRDAEQRDALRAATKPKDKAPAQFLKELRDLHDEYGKLLNARGDHDGAVEHFNTALECSRKIKEIPKTKMIARRNATVSPDDHKTPPKP